MKKKGISSESVSSESNSVLGNDTRPEVTDGNVASFFRSWRYFFWFLGIVLLIGLFYVEENWRGHRAWETYKHEMETRGERFEARAFVPQPVPERENFARTPFLAPLFEFIPGTQKWVVTNAVARAMGLAPAYDAAASEVKQQNKARSNSWVTARTDLMAWHAAFLRKGQRTSKVVSKPIVGESEGEPRNALLSASVLGSAGIEDSGELIVQRRQEAAAGVLAALSECDSVIEELRAASQRPYSRFGIRYDEEDPAGILLPHLGVLKHMSQVLQLRASAELVLGRTDEAAADINLMLYLANACRDEPIMLSQLVRMAQLKLAIQPIAEGVGQWSEVQLRAFQERLLRFDFGADMQRALQAERVFFGGGVIDFLHRNPEKYNALIGNGDGPGVPGVMWAVVPSGWFDFEKLNYSRLFENYEMAGLDLPGHRISPAASQRAEERISALMRKPWPTLFLRHRVFCGFLLPGFAGPLRKTAYAQTAADTAAVACALERYRLAHRQFPESLDALSPRSGEAPTEGSQAKGVTEFMGKVPNDIINGQPLKYRRTEDGQYVLYSVGWNETADEGKVEFGKGEVDVPQQGDWVFRPLASDR